MKSRLYYGLFIIYAVMVAFVMYINGVFTSNVTSYSNLIINGVFLGIIGILFLISAVSFTRLNRLTDELEDVTEDILEEYKKVGNKNIWGVLEVEKDVFAEKNLRGAFGKFRARIRNGRRGTQYTNVCDIEDYINDELLESVGSNYFNSAISGTMTGLGILGTFIGLSLGLGSFDGNDIYTISDNVGPLLSGMKVAFHTSVYGIIFSLIFNFVYRSIMADAYDKLNYFLNVFRQCAAPPSAGGGDENMAAMLVYQANQVNYTKELLELMRGEAASQAKAMEQLVNSFMAQLQRTMGTEFKDLGISLRVAAQTQATNAESMKVLLDSANALAEANRNMQETMARMMGRQEQQAAEVAEQRRQLEAACGEISQDVKNQLYTFQQMRTLYEDEK